jgi:hypothetical protein
VQRQIGDNNKGKHNETQTNEHLLRGLAFSALATLAVSVSLSEVGSPELTAQLHSNKHCEQVDMLAQFTNRGLSAFNGHT